MRELDPILPTLEPPAAGLERLQRRIAAPQRRPRNKYSPRWAWATALVVPVLVLAIWIPQRVAHQQRIHATTATLQQALLPQPLTNGIHVTDGGAIELPSGQADVRLYLVQTATPAPLMHRPD